MPRVPETLVVMLGAWKAGAVYVPIFTGFGPDAIDFRVGHSGARVLCTTGEYRAASEDGDREDSAIPASRRVTSAR